MKEYLEIINHFGVRNQMKKLNEECYEFLESVDIYEDSKAENTSTRLLLRDHVVEEMADILILLTQFIAKYEISQPEIDKFTDYKLERTKERIKTGYYDNQQ